MIDFAATDIWGDGAVRRGGLSRPRMTRIAPLLALPRLLAEFGIELAPLLADTGLPTDLFDGSDTRAPVEALVRLVARCARIANRPELGLLIGQSASPSALGAAVRPVAGAPSVERALRGIIMSLHLNGEAVVPALATTADIACFSLTPYDDHPDGIDHLADVSLAQAINILRVLCGSRWAPTLVMLAHREPADRRAYDTFFRAPIRFNAEITGVEFERSWLLHRPDDLSHTFPGTALEAADEMQALDIATRARRAVIACMMQGTVDVDSAAAFCGVSKRTLNRKLAERGTSAKDLIAAVRIQIAQQLMRDTDLSIADIVATTCYSDVAAFSRAFRTRAGMTPAAWRRMAAPARLTPRD